jgi:hypothetical protein
VGIENAVFHRRLQRKMRSKDERLRELYARTCTVCGLQAEPARASVACVAVRFVRPSLLWTLSSPPI